VLSQLRGCTEVSHSEVCTATVWDCFTGIACADALHSLTSSHPLLCNIDLRVLRCSFFTSIQRLTLRSCP
jgi:hypothetical protein